MLKLFRQLHSDLRVVIRKEDVRDYLNKKKQVDKMPRKAELGAKDTEAGIKTLQLLESGCNEKKRKASIESSAVDSGNENTKKQKLDAEVTPKKNSADASKGKSPNKTQQKTPESDKVPKKAPKKRSNVIKSDDEVSDDNKAEKRRDKKKKRKDKPERSDKGDEHAKGQKSQQPARCGKKVVDQSLVVSIPFKEGSVAVGDKAAGMSGVASVASEPDTSTVVVVDETIERPPRPDSNVTLPLDPGEVLEMPSDSEQDPPPVSSYEEVLTASLMTPACSEHSPGKDVYDDELPELVEDEEVDAASKRKYSIEDRLSIMESNPRLVQVLNDSSDMPNLSISESDTTGEFPYSSIKFDSLSLPFSFVMFVKRH